VKDASWEHPDEEDFYNFNQMGEFISKFFRDGVWFTIDPLQSCFW
jgi:hypothetical protein